MSDTKEDRLFGQMKDAITEYLQHRAVINEIAPDEADQWVDPIYEEAIDLIIELT
ncbi:MAG: hypothetical protein R3330_09305 [Saprospiraceae bacterium]|nr:hypothetical protein [Saprospiraceae bacterium]